MSEYDSDQSMGQAPLTPGLSQGHSMRVSTCSSEDRSPTPERAPKRRRTYNPFGPLPNGNGTHRASPASGQPGHSAAAALATIPPSRAMTMPSPGALPSNIGMPIPGSPHSFGESREFLPLILSRGLFFNRAHIPCPPTSLSLAAQSFARVPAFPRLRNLDWRLRMNSWPTANKDESRGEMDPYIASVRRTLSNTW